MIDGICAVNILLQLFLACGTHFFCKMATGSKRLCTARSWSSRAHGVMRRAARRAGDRGRRPPRGAPRPATAGAPSPCAGRAQTAATPRMQLQREPAQAGEMRVGLGFHRRSRTPAAAAALAARRGPLCRAGIQNPLQPCLETLYLPAKARTRRSSARRAHQTLRLAGAPPGGTLRRPPRPARRGGRRHPSAPPTRACSTSTRPRCCPARRPAGRPAAAAARCGGTWRPRERSGEDEFSNTMVEVISYQQACFGK